MPADHETPAAPLLDGRYRLGELLGEGGMARVYRAEDTSLGRVVAIKLIRPGLEGLAVPERARSETTVLASLNHPSLVTLFDARLVPGQPEYLVMELVDGPTLGDLIGAGPLPSAEVAALAAELGEALHVVHSAGIVHRDVKPSNVLFAPPHVPGGRARAKLADFGIALLLDTARVTSPGTVIGTAAYLSPEQVRGADPAASADVYALGLVLLEALTGHRAYPQLDSVGAALARLSTPPEIPATLGGGWGELLRRMTAADPAERPTALDVVTTVERLHGRADAAVPAAGADDVAAVAEVGTASASAVVEGVAPAGGAPTRPYTDETVAMPPLPPAVLGPSAEVSASMDGKAKRRRPLAVLGGIAAGAVVVAAAAWMVGATMATAPDPAPVGVTGTPTIESPVATPAAPSPDETPEVVERDTAEQPEEDAADEAAEEAAVESEKAAEESRKAAEKAAKEAAKEANRERRGPKNDG